MKFRTLIGFTVLLFPLFFTNVQAALQGPKKRITIMAFEDKSGGATPWGTAVSSGLAGLISAALAKSGKCLVFETGAALILTGDVTEFGVRHQSIVTGIERESARCVLDVRFIDTLTGQVIAAEKAVGEAAAHHGTDDGDNLAAIKFGGARFNQTLIGQATRQAVDRSVALIEKNLAAAPWYGRIIKANEGTIIIDSGIEDSRTVGHEFDVVRQGEPVFDPRTGETLGREKTPVGRIRLVAILGPRKARAVALDQALPQTGDVLQ